MPATLPRRRAAVRGLVLLPLLAAVLAVVLLLLAGWTRAAAGRAEERQQGRRAQLLAQAEALLSDWYQVHLAELDSPGGVPPDPAPVLAALPGAGTLRVNLGPLESVSGTPGRRLALWDGTAPSAAARVVDGHRLEQAALGVAREHLQRLAGVLEQWSRARLLADPLHRADRSLFRPQDPDCLAGLDELPCLPEYAPLAGLPFVARQLALDAAALRTPWGSCCPVEASNGADASAAPPFTLALRIRTPWNLALTAFAVQPTGAP